MVMVAGEVRRGARREQRGPWLAVARPRGVQARCDVKHSV